MQPTHRKMAANIQRAVNVRDLGPLGDPERWGGVADAVIVVPPEDPSDQSFTTHQMLRVQCDDLIARTWELVATYRIVGLDPTDLYEVRLDVRWGTGQASGQGTMLLAPVPVAAAPATWWERTPTVGTIHVTQPVPAVAMSVRGILRVQGTGVPSRHRVIAHLGAWVAPRSVV